MNLYNFLKDYPEQKNILKKVIKIKIIEEF